MGKGLAVSVFDLDPQRSAEQWSELREASLETEEPAVVHGTATGLDGMLQAARDTETDLVLIDTPPAVDKSMIYAAAAGDVVIVPTRSSVFDQFALRETLDYLKRIGALMKTIVILNAPSADKEARADTERIALAEFGVALLDIVLDEHVDLATSLRGGRGITESAPKRKAAKVVQEIYQQLCQFERKLARTKSRVTA
jgi:cellulose biosynthesis protein BcsQ